VPGERAQAMDVADVQDEARVLRERRRRCLRQEERRAQVRADQVVELVGRDCADGRRIEGGCIVDEHVETSEGAHDLGDERVTGCRVGEVGTEGARRAGAFRIQAGDESVRIGLRASIVDCDPRAGRMQGLGDDGADTARGAGDEYRLAGERCRARIHDALSFCTIAGRYHGPHERPC